MVVRIVRLGSDSVNGEGLRIGTVRRTPRGVPKTRGLLPESGEVDGREVVLALTVLPWDVARHPGAAGETSAGPLALAT
jgi:hypothetical protein